MLDKNVSLSRSVSQSVPQSASQAGLKKDSLESVSSWIPIVLILSLAVVLRCYQLGTESLWIDENFSIRDARTLNLGTRPLYYLILHLWMQFGTSDAWLRALSIPFSVACVFLTYLLARRLLSESSARIAAFLMAVSPLCVGYGQEIRMYALSTFLTLWGTLMLVRFLERPKRKDLGGWAILRLLAILTTPLNVTLLLPDILVFGWRFRHQKRWLMAIGLVLLGVGLLSLPSLSVLQTAAPRFFDSWVAYRDKPDILTIPAMLTSFTVFWPLTDLTPLGELQLHPSAWRWNEIVMFFYMGYTVLSMSFVGLGIALVLTRPKRDRFPGGFVWVAVWGLLPAICLLGISYLFASIWLERYLLFVCPYILILLAYFFRQMWHHYRSLAIAIAAVYFVAVGGGLVHYYTTLYHDDWRGVAQWIETHETSEDAIGVYAREWEFDLALPRYYQGAAPIHQLQLEPLKGKRSQLTPTWLKQQLRTLPPGKSHYWIAVYLPWNRGMQLTREAIESEFHLLDYRTFPNSVNADLELFHVEPRDLNPMK